MAELIRRSALAGLLAPATYGASPDRPALTLAERPAVSIVERRPAALLRLWADANDGGFARAVARMTALALAYAPNTAVAHDGRALLWLAPGQWLLVCDEKRPAISETELQAAFDGTTGTVVDVSHAYAVVAIAGERARDVLAKGVPVDVDAGAFAARACVQTCLAEMNVLVHARQVESIDLYVGRSYASSLWEWVCTSAAEFGHRPEESGARR